jgi:electron transfer flavoprotein beta subunit
MNTLVLMKMVPDVVEEMEVAADGKALDTEFLRLILSESDDHALEEALLLKERRGGTVTVLAVESPEVDDALFTSLAKGADRAFKVTAGDAGPTTRAAAHILAGIIREGHGIAPPDLILTGTQAIDDLDGQIAPMVAQELGLPYLGIVTQVSLADDGKTISAVKEYPGSIRGEFEITLPAALGIQAAEKPPRYVPVAKVRAAMKSQKIEEIAVATLADGGVALAGVVAMSKPAVAGQAEMLDGTPEEVSGKICAILAGRGLL